MIGNTKPQGFTLLETVTVVAIFSITLVAVLNIYLLFFKNESQVERQTEVASSGRFVLQAITQALDTASIDYDYYGSSVPNRPPILALITPQHQTIRFRYEPTSKVVQMCTSQAADLPCDTGNPNEYKPLNDDVNSPIDSFQLWVSPDKDPFTRSNTGIALSNQQPRVTIVIHLTDRKGENGFSVQTTFTSRVYER